MKKLYVIAAAAFLFTPCQGWLLPPKIAPSPTVVPATPSQPPIIADRGGRA